MSRHLVCITLLTIVPSAAMAADKAAPKPRRVYFYNWGPNQRRPLIVHGMNPQVRVQLPTRLDWRFASSSAALASAPAETALQDPTQITYQLWVPRSYKHTVPHPLVLFLSAQQFPDEWGTWVDTCSKHGVMFASLTGGGSNVHPTVRMRLALEMFDDLRRRMAVDTDRIYVSGTGDGARTACELAFAYPEFVGGVLAIGGASSPRHEPWLRLRMKERLSIAYVTGGFDSSRREIETFRFPVVRDLGARTRLWSVPLQSNLMPASSVIEQAYLWLEAAQAERKKLAVIAPATRMPEGTVPLPEVWAMGVLNEARDRLKTPEFRNAGLMQLQGIPQRFSGTLAAREAEKLLDQHNKNNKSKWQEVFESEQRRFAYLEAKGFSDYLYGPLPVRDLIRKGALIDELEGIWKQVIDHGADTEDAREAQRRIEQLKKDFPIR